MSIGQEIIDGLKQFIRDLREGNPITITKVVRKGNKYRFIKGRTDKPHDVEVSEMEVEDE